jgi:intracellular sulfur oxidation DsrE/DsrF family protein
MTNARAVWDFITGDSRRFCDRVELIIATGEEFKRRGIVLEFVLLLHSQATQFGARTLAGTKFEGRGTDLSASHAVLQRFSEMGGRIELCGLAMERSSVAADNVIPCAVVVHNVIVSLVELQNRGYAYMQVA